MVLVVPELLYGADNLMQPPPSDISCETEALLLPRQEPLSAGQITLNQLVLVVVEECPVGQPEVLDDLKEYEARVVSPIKTDTNGHTFVWVRPAEERKPQTLIRLGVAPKVNYSRSSMPNGTSKVTHFPLTHLIITTLYEILPVAPE